MTKPQMTVAEARAAGLFDEPKRKRTTRKAEPRAGAITHCVTHDETFTTDADENRHVDAQHGCRLEWRNE